MAVFKPKTARFWCERRALIVPKAVLLKDEKSLADLAKRTGKDMEVLLITHNIDDIFSGASVDGH